MNKLKIVIIAFVVLATGYLGFSSFNRIQQKKKISAAIQRLPEFSFERHQSGQFTQADIEDKKAVINFFNPDCDHCQYMAGELAKNKEKLADIQLIMVTTADSLSVDKFNQTYKLNEIPNLVLLRDTRYQFQTIFGARIIPSFYVYDEEQTLVKKITGDTKIENLLK